MRFNTQLLHGGTQRNERFGATLAPIYQVSSFYHESAEDLEKIFANKKPGFAYTRIGNPTVSEFERRVNVIEGGFSTIAFSSGMAAITNGLLALLQAGDEIIVSASLYGGTIDLFHDIAAFGITTHFVRTNDIAAFEAAISDRTRLIFAEVIGNPQLDVTDIARLAECAHGHGLPLFIDNTVSTPYLVNPIKLGADVVVQSSSKYINGSSNGISGVLTDAGKFQWSAERFPALKDFIQFGKFAYTAKLKNTLYHNFGACLSPQNAFLNLIGLETLGLRVQRECDNALALARWISQNYPAITVNYPGLQSSPWHEIARRQFGERYGAILTVRVGSKEKAFALINGLRLPLRASNIGDSKTLVLHPASTISVHSSAAEQEAAGVFPDLVRISTGFEDIEDLIEDFRRVLDEILQ